LSIKENNPIEIEAKWQKYWADNKTFAAHTRKPKHYVLTCFLIHLVLVYVGHPLGYIASDVYSRYKDIKDTMFCTYGYDSFGLPAEQ
jgi:leucyl-tRNA synthetase